MLLILFDIHRNILSTQGIIQYTTTESATKLEITFKDDNIYLSLYAGSRICKNINVDLPKNIFLPCSISSVDPKESSKLIVNEEKNFVHWTSLPFVDNQVMNDKTVNIFKVAFRLRLSDISYVQNYLPTTTPVVNFKDFIRTYCEKSRMYDLLCTNCGILLTEHQISFQFLLDYNEGMSELAETWFCHKHDDHHSFEPKGDYLYIDDVHFYFHDSVIKQLKLSEGNKIYKCANCSSTLSLKKKMNHPNFIGFYCDKIMFHESEKESSNFQDYKNSVALYAFYSLIEDTLKLAVSCKIYLQSKVEEQIECLLLWINSQKIVQFLLHAINEDDIPKEAAFETKEVLKVLYCVTPSSSELSKKWKHDFSVEFFQISDNMMTVIREILEKSSKLCLPDQETISGFSFGYLPGYISFT